MIAVPEFYYGAMENWGLIIYKETRMLYHPEENTVIDKIKTTQIIAHEIAHQVSEKSKVC